MSLAGRCSHRPNLFLGKLANGGLILGADEWGHYFELYLRSL